MIGVVKREPGMWLEEYCPYCDELIGNADYYILKNEEYLHIGCWLADKGYDMLRTLLFEAMDKRQLGVLGLDVEDEPEPADALHDDGPFKVGDLVRLDRNPGRGWGDMVIGGTYTVIKDEYGVQTNRRIWINTGLHDRWAARARSFKRVRKV